MAETNLVGVARAEAGLPLIADTAENAAPRPSGLRRARRILGYVPFFRAFVAIEASLLALAAAIGDEIAGSLDVTRALLLVLVAAGVITVAGHLVGILSSQRLR
jgi:hypothetical protein